MADPGRSKRLAEFTQWVRTHLRGDEKGEAQIFLDRLFQAFGHNGVNEAGATLEMRIKNKDRAGTAFADLVWKPVVLIEMKKRGVDLSRHLVQAFDYWTKAVPDRPRFVVLCNFDQFYIYDFDKDIYEPQDIVTLEELPERYAPLNFLFPTREEPLFKINREKVTREAADLLADTYKLLVKRKDVPQPLAQRFILQILVCFFAEDIGLLPDNFVTQLLNDCTDPPTTFDLLRGLFSAMNSRNRAPGGRYRDIPYFNGGLFAEPAPIELHDKEIQLLKQSSASNWSAISPDIFGTIFQHSMDDKERGAFGAHYTSPADIQKIVKPTIADPWREAIRRANTLRDLRALQQRLHRYRVLDPACGSGNFLYLAYRELKRIELELHEKIRDVSTARDKSQQEIGVVTTRQFFGLDILPFAVELAKVTLTLAPKLAIDELHIEEQALPLDNLDGNILVADALVDRSDPKNPTITPWPEVDVIIGNPPFLGAKRLKPEHGDAYVNTIRKLYPDIPGMADYCVYWFRRAHDHLPECTERDPLAGRAGLVGTQNIRNNKSREGGLDHIVESGTIIDAVDNQPWSGEANVHVSIANWIKTKNEKILPKDRTLWFVSKQDTAKGKRSRKGEGPASKRYTLDNRAVDHITASLSDAPDVAHAKPLACNKSPQVCFQGIVTGYSGFVISHATRSEMIRLDPSNAAVVRPYLIGRDLMSGSGKPSRAIVDFAGMDQIEARQYTLPWVHVENNVLASVESAAHDSLNTDMGHARNEHLNRWWQFWNVRTEMRKSFSVLRRYTAVSRTTRRPVFVFVSTGVCPDSKIQTFAIEDDYGFTVLQSSAHWAWWTAKGARLKCAEDRAYSSRSVWDTFPFPQSPTVKQVDAVAEAGRAVRSVRAELLPRTKGGLRALYRQIETPGKHPLKDAHADLDAVVIDAYGFSPRKNLLKQLLGLNLAVASAIDQGDAVEAPGIPSTYPKNKRRSLITDDCITYD